MYLGITESKNTSTSQHILDGECHAHAHASGVARTQPMESRKRKGVKPRLNHMQRLTRNEIAAVQSGFGVVQYVTVGTVHR